MVQIYKVSEEIHRYPANYFNIEDYEHNIIISTEVFTNYLKTNYNFYYLKVPLDTAFFDFTNSTYDDFMSMWYAWITDYKPLENYNRDETIQRIKNIGNEKTTNGGDVTTESNTENDDNNKPATKHYTTTYDSTSENRLESYDVSTGKTNSETTTTQNTTSETEYKNITVGETTAHEIETTTNRTYGNIGVTTSQQMLQSEIDLRMKHLIELYFEQFCKKYLFYVGGDTDVYSHILH